MLCVIPLTQGRAHILNIVVMACSCHPAFLQACTGQLVICLIYSSRPVVDETARPRSCCVDGWNTRPDTQQPSSFRGDLRVIRDSIRSQKNIIHDFLSAARHSAFMRGEKVGNTQRKEVSWSWLGKAIAANHVIWCLISHFSTRPHWWKHFFVTIRTEIAFVCLVCKHHLYFL